jgi:cell division protein FtsL
MKLRGRVWLGLWLVLFLVVSLAIVARQRAALLTAGELNRLREERLALEAERADYLRRIREASSQRVLIPRVQTRLQLRMPSDSEYVTFEVPAPGGPDR